MWALRSVHFTIHSIFGEDSMNDDGESMDGVSPHSSPILHNQTEMGKIQSNCPKYNNLQVRIKIYLLGNFI
jgi:hypothetical protein